ncbi:hypothetical protein MMC14_005123 [Varicellaria rhodocarpa]|nr:hypothetical protein [Varicellaria rhodocarpa]
MPPRKRKATAKAAPPPKSPTPPPLSSPSPTISTPSPLKTRPNPFNTDDEVREFLGPIDISVQLTYTLYFGDKQAKKNAQIIQLRAFDYNVFLLDRMEQMDAVIGKGYIAKRVATKAVILFSRCTVKEQITLDIENEEAWDNLTIMIKL